jgi:hypothetical protein
MKEIVKKGLFFLILGLLFIPLLQFFYPFLEENKLNGSFNITEKPSLDSLSYDWFNSRHQETYDDYFNDHIGFRPFFIKTYNQFRFSCYNTVSSTAAIKGKGGVLYDARYITTTLGHDFMGGDIIKEKVKDIKFVKEQLELEGKRLLIVIAPNKGRYNADEIPDYFKKIDTTNYEVYLTHFDNQDIDYIDFNDWFLKKKKNSDYNLIPKYGTHWSIYGSMLSADSIIKFCNSNYNYKLPTYNIDSLVIKETSNYAMKNGIKYYLDYDLGDNLNLWWKLKGERYVYPHTHIIKDADSKKKNLLVISDSFFEPMYYSDFSTEIFSMSGYWYYNKKVVEIPERNKQPEDLKATLPNTDLVIIMLTEWNMYRLGFGVIEELKAYYSGEETMSPDVIHYIERIRADKKWYNDIKKSAKERGISDYEMLVRSAKWMVREKAKKK